MTTAFKKETKNINTPIHSHPIPSRGYIIGLLRKHTFPLRRVQLATLMSLSGDEEKEGLRRRLRAMERDGQIIFEPRQGYRVLKSNELLYGRVIGHPDGFGFLERDKAGDDLLLNHRDMMKLFDGDRVQVCINGKDRRGREKATLIKIIERNTSQVVGQLSVDQGNYFITPENNRIAHEIDIENNQLMGATAGQYVVVTLTGYPCYQYRALGKVTEVLGNAMAPGMEIDIAIRKYGIPYKWSRDVIKTTESIGAEVTESDKLHRVDLRTLPFVTIDSEDAKDFDDAIYCMPQNDGWCLWVAIADVSHYVSPDSALDCEAQKRGTSVYFPGQVIPMLPEALSNGLCSLNPHVDRLVMACKMMINSSGRMTSYEFSEAIIHSHARLTYNQVNAILSSPKSKLGKHMMRKHSTLVPHIHVLHQLYGAFKKARTVRSSINFDTQEVSLQLNKDRKVAKIFPVERNDAHKLVEECMLCANVAAARFLKRLQLPALYRNHSGPQERKLKRLRDFLGENKLNLTGGNKPSPTHYNHLMNSLHNRADASTVQSMILRSLGQAEYSPDNLGHFGLAYSAYTHFTSPIRRYPDLLVHRAIRSVIQGPESGGRIYRTLKKITGMGKDPVQRFKSVSALGAKNNYPYDIESISLLASKCSQLSRRADQASQDVYSWLKCNYMQHSIGEKFTGIITSVRSFGLFIELVDTRIEGLLHISALDKDFYNFDEALQTLVGNRKKNIYAIGDTLQIYIAGVDMDQRRIAFKLTNQTTKHKKILA
jgi:ribonuclease R